jgi:hypothetical protein
MRPFLNRETPISQGVWLRQFDGIGIRQLSENLQEKFPLLEKVNKLDASAWENQQSATSNQQRPIADFGGSDAFSLPSDKG